MQVLELSKYPPNNDNDFGITWEVTSNCTQDCRYCDLHKNEKTFYPEKIIKFINKLSEHKNVILTLFGGEPTSHPDFIKILQKLNNNITLGIFTNLSKDIYFLEKILEIKSNIKFETSYHPSFTNYLEYKKKIKFLIERGVSVSIAFMYDTSINDLKQKYGELCSICKETSPNIIDYFDQIVSKEEKDWILEELKNKSKNIFLKYQESGVVYDALTTPSFLWMNNINNYKYYLCECGKKCFYISSNGDVYPCLDYKKNNFDKFFNVNENYTHVLNRVLEKGIICKSDRCTSEIDVRKTRILKI